MLERKALEGTLDLKKLEKRPHCLTVDATGAQLWIVSATNHVYLYEGGEVLGFEIPSLRRFQYDATRIKTTPFERGIWVQSPEYGVVKLTREGFYSLRDNPGEHNTRALASTRGGEELLILNEDGALVRYGSQGEQLWSALPAEHMNLSISAAERQMLGINADHEVLATLKQVAVRGRKEGASPKKIHVPWYDRFELDGDVVRMHDSYNYSELSLADLSISTIDLKTITERAADVRAMDFKSGTYLVQSRHDSSTYWLGKLDFASGEVSLHPLHDAVHSKRLGRVNWLVDQTAEGGLLWFESGGLQAARFLVFDAKGKSAKVKG